MNASENSTSGVLDATGAIGAPESDVLVIGGGLAGITAALDCARAGARVTLLEVRRRLGGAAYSFERDGLRIDNGQHVFLRCCTAYRTLLCTLGSDRGVRLQRRLEIPVLSPGRAPALLRRNGLPAPLHLASTLLRYPHLSFRSRLRAIRAALALGRLDSSDEEIERETLGRWLGEHGQGPEAVSKLWDLIALSTLNLPAAQASPGLGAFVFKTALLSGASAGDIGFHERPLSETIAEPALRALTRASVRVLLGVRAEAIEREAGGFRVRVSGAAGRRGENAGAGLGNGVAGTGAGEGLRARTIVLAVPHARAGRLLRDLDSGLAAGLERLGSSPIVNVHVVYDRPVCELSFAAGVDTPVQYLFDRTAAAGVPAGCQYLAVSLSCAEREMAMSVDELRETYLPALSALLPRAREARVEWFLITREHAATFRAVPGVQRLRPGARTSTPGLALAGAWTNTGWPATLEGAVLSGHAAAEEALRALGAVTAATAPAGWAA